MTCFNSSFLPNQFHYIDALDALQHVLRRVNGMPLNRDVRLALRRERVVAAIEQVSRYWTRRTSRASICLWPGW